MLEPELSLSVDDYANVVIVPNEHVSDFQWTKTVLYWTLGSASAQKQRLLALPIQEFVEKASWLRDVWLSQEGKLRYSQDLIIAWKSVKEGSTAFRMLSTLNPDRHSGQNTQVPDLFSARKLTFEQQENVLCLLEMQNGANFSVPGAGKTLTALAVWKILRQRGQVNKILVVCPRSAFASWKDELTDSFIGSANFEIFSGDILASTTDLCVVNYEQLENIGKLHYLENWIKVNNALLVVDEAHRIKGGRNSVRWIALKVLSVVAARVDVLTGTPMPQGPRDLSSIYSVAWPRLSNNDLDERLLVSLKRKTAFVRTTKDELKLREPKIRVISEPPGPLQSQILGALQDRYVGSFGLSIGDQRNMAKRGKAVMTMLAAATNPGLLVARQFSDIEMGFSWPPELIASDATLSTLVEDYLNHELPWKFRYVALRVQEIANRGEKVLVWTSFVGNLAALKKVLAKFHPAVIYGGTSIMDRETELNKFRSNQDCLVLLSNPQTLGEGISLHKYCHSEIFVDRTYNAGLYLQAVDRIHRLGLEPDQETNIEILQTARSIDERVEARLEVKIRALANFLQDKRLTQTALPQDDAYAPVDVLGLGDDDFEDIASYWGSTK